MGQPEPCKKRTRQTAEPCKKRTRQTVEPCIAEKSAISSGSESKPKSSQGCGGRPRGKSKFEEEIKKQLGEGAEASSEDNWRKCAQKVYEANRRKKAEDLKQKKKDAQEKTPPSEPKPTSCSKCELLAQSAPAAQPPRPTPCSKCELLAQKILFFENCRDWVAHEVRARILGSKEALPQWLIEHANAIQWFFRGTTGSARETFCTSLFHLRGTTASAHAPVFWVSLGFTRCPLDSGRQKVGGKVNGVTVAKPCSLEYSDFGRCDGGLILADVVFFENAVAGEVIASIKNKVKLEKDCLVFLRFL